MLLLADNIRITLPSIARAVETGEAASVADLAARCTVAGAHILDINTGPLTRNPEAGMAFFVDAVQKASSLPLCLDTSNPSAMEAGLERLQGGRAIVNGVSIASERFLAMVPLVKRYKAQVVAFLLQEDGHVPPDADTRLTLAASLVPALVEEGIPAERILVDPVCVPLLWGDGLAQARAVIETVRLLPQVLGHSIRTVAGLSNLTTGSGPMENKRAARNCYLSMLAEAGLSAVLGDIMDPMMVKTARAAQSITSGTVFSWESL